FLPLCEGRLEAPASAHGLLNDSNWEVADLAELVRKLVTPYTLESSLGYRMEGEPFVLPIDLATPFGLVLHELVTNAVKYGSLSRPGGMILMKWSVKSTNGERVLDFIWQEGGGPPGERPDESVVGAVMCH